MQVASIIVKNQKNLVENSQSNIPLIKELIEHNEQTKFNSKGLNK